MKCKFKKIILISRQPNTRVAKTFKTLIKCFKTLRLEVALEQETAALFPTYKLAAIPREQLGKHCELLVVIGGDGSLLNAARIAAVQNLPVVGINRGKLGFLTDIYPEEIKPIKSILAGNYLEEQRFLLDIKAIYKRKTLKQDIAVNDVVLLSSEPGRMTEFSVNIDNHFVCTYRADGLIVATPTGSTAHALSGGGPILHPNLKAIVLVPMFSHNLSSRSTVINANSTIKLCVSKNNIKPLHLVCDGYERIEIPAMADIHIQKAAQKLCLIHPPKYNYFETLRTKLHWEK